MVLYILSVHVGPAEATFLPLSTESRWITNGYGKRVKLACINWPSHLEPVLAEGLDKQLAYSISARVRLMGFNCVRFTWPLELPLNETLGNLTVKQSFQRLGLKESLAGIEVHNPWIVDLPLMTAYEEMLAVMERKGLMVILDNHVTTPGWCCGLNDGNGFFGDEYFDPKMWIKGLMKMARMAQKFPNVIGMSLRNELRGPKSNVDDWYKHMEQGAEAVHSENPNVLVILSGMSFDKDFSFLHNRPVNISFSNKLVFELHWYSFSNGNAWKTGDSNKLCGQITASMMDSAGFLAKEKGYPIFVSEFGVDMAGKNVGDNKFLSCFMAAAAEQDWDYAVWALPGSYYFRQGTKDMDESYGLMNHNWTAVRNITTLKRINALRLPFRGPGWNRTIQHKVIFHPLTGLCVEKRPVKGPLRLMPCQMSQMWTYTANKTLEITGTHYVLGSSGKAEKMVPLTVSLPHQKATQWDMVSDSKLHLATKAEDGSELCLDVDRYGLVITNKCKCMDGGDPNCDPASQWFKLVNSTMV
ncbi:hypothetical protein SAY87_016877 [Trapa incisa]|uniref:Glycoside hydrolase family 5 domain-containing protein n=1 Tax=Trapa incisa TaxID=236973 RepID=A0AAN7LHM9_9MYRT|nr:hypothetical protein SAY87_016877 [Trapa incisa]